MGTREVELRPSSVVNLALVVFVVKFSIVVKSSLVVRLVVVRTVDTMMVFPLRMIVRMVKLVVVYERGSVEQLPLPLVPHVLVGVHVVVVVAHVVSPVVTPFVWVTVCVPVVSIFPPMLARDELLPRSALRCVPAVPVVTRGAPRDEDRDDEPHAQVQHGGGGCGGCGFCGVTMFSCFS